MCLNVCVVGTFFSLVVSILNQELQTFELLCKLLVTSFNKLATTALALRIWQQTMCSIATNNACNGCGQSSSFYVVVAIVT